MIEKIHKTTSSNKVLTEYHITDADEDTTVVLDFSSSSSHNCDRGNAMLHVKVDAGEYAMEHYFMLSYEDVQALADIIYKHKKPDGCECCDKYNSDLPDERKEMMK